MKVLILVGCLVLGAHADRFKRVVGGEKAAIPQPIAALTTQSGAAVSKTTTAASVPPTSTSSTTKSGNSGSTGKGTTKPATSTTPIQTSTDSAVDTTSSPDSVSIFEEERSSQVFGIKEKDGYIAFKGIRYAQAPLDKNRFQRPILAHLKGVVEAFDYGSPCVQLLPNDVDTTGNEDCLYLNVYTPSVYNRNASGLPVLFWIHGGGFMRGSGNQYGVRDIVLQNIVVVTMNYRLGALGFLGSSSKQMSGNAALFDIRAAFEWTRRYITYFGGNPRRIFAAGQGSGASVAMLFAQSDFTAGYIQGVLAMSGTGISSSAVDYAPDNTTTFISQTTNCNGLNPLNTVRCLQNCDLKYILNVQKKLESDRIGNGGFVNAVSKLLSAGPVVEGKNDGRFLPFFLTNNPLDALKEKSGAKNIPLLIGTTKSETGKSVTGKYKSDVEKRLKIPEFLNKVLPRNLLHNNVGLFTAGAVNKLLDTLFNSDKYLGLLTGILGKGLSEFQKVIETTTDALFNLPAAATSNLWDGESYFYNFQYQSEKVLGNSFLQGLPLHSNASQSAEKSPSHGDDLIYLFECQTLTGEPSTDSVLTDPKDLKVKNIFVSVVTEFLKTGKPRLPNSKKDEWRPFKQDNAYAIISDMPKIEKKFRFCEIALWGGLTDILTAPFCSSILPGIADLVKGLPADLLNGGILSKPLKSLTTNLLKNPIKVGADKLIGNHSLLGTPHLNLLGGGSKAKTTTPSSTTVKLMTTTRKSPLGGLGVKLPNVLG